MRLTETMNTLVLDSEFRETVGELGAVYPELRLSCPSETDDPAALAGAGSFHCLITKTVPVHRDLLDKLPDLKLLLKMGRRYTNVDLEAVRTNIVVAALHRNGWTTARLVDEPRGHSDSS